MLPSSGKLQQKFLSIILYKHGLNVAAQAFKCSNTYLSYPSSLTYPDAISCCTIFVTGRSKCQLFSSYKGEFYIPWFVPELEANFSLLSHCLLTLQVRWASCSPVQSPLLIAKPQNTDNIIKDYQVRTWQDT